jgi:pyrophosphatase PpaX
MKLKGILFDLDGTLADTLPVCVEAFQITVKHFGNWIPNEDEITRYFGTNEEGILEKFFPGQLNKTLPYYLDVYERIHEQKCAKPFPGVDKALSTLNSRGIHTAIVTGKGAKSASISMRILGLAQWIKIVEPGFADKADKPFSIKKVLERWGMLPDQAAYVGDTPYDMAASREAGLMPIGAAWASTSMVNNQSPLENYKIFYKLDDFIQWIDLV